ncbi:hypothetical protein DFH07DRAFT_300657 [Mycena maculata]|uniref:Uncharacterized protein n=1 Tax=Mycena maculata TaxID=230809 RepID=A0AAD7NPC2_9AGAR|nr:hypothetical protein DFH07DRAFT_300657 [Mycena maculata]
MDLRKEYDTVRAENHRLQEACGNIAQLVNHLRKDDTANNTGTSHDQGHENVDRRPGTITIDLTNDDEEEVVVQESRPCESQTRPTGVSVDDAGSSTGARTPKPSSDKMKIYKNHMNALPLLPDHPGIAQLKPICEYSSTLTLEDITKMVDSSIPSHPVLYVQRHTILMKKGHFIACGLTHRYDSNTEKWTAESDLQGLHAKRRELFVARGDNLFYAGLYECVDLDMLYPGNRMCLPPRIGFAEFAESAFSPEITKKTGKLRSYLAGKPLEVVSLGLRCVGFNRELYDTLRGGSGGKRAAESEGGGPRKKQKRSKGTGTA